VEYSIDVTAAEAIVPEAVYSIRVRRADGVNYEVESGLTAGEEKRIGYTFTQQDLAVAGATWVTITATLGGAVYEWVVIGWVSNAAYDGGYSGGTPLWTQALLAMVAADNGSANTGSNGGNGSGGSEGGLGIMAFQVTIYPEDWMNGEATISNEGIGAANEGYVTMPTGATASEYETYANARIRVVEQVEGSITIAATGDTPTNALKIRVVQFV
jgi:hypothetical protein